MKALAALLLVAACGSDHYTPPPDAGGSGQPYTACSGDAAAFVRQSFLALDGRRPLGQPEVDVYVDLYNAAAAKGADPKEAVARAIMARPEFTERLGVLLATGLVVGDSIAGLIYAGAVGALGDPERLSVVGESFVPISEWVAVAAFIALLVAVYARTKAAALRPD